MDGGADIVSFGGDADQPSWWSVHRRLVAAAAAIALVCTGITLGLLLSQPPRTRNAEQAQAVIAMLRGAPFRPDPQLGSLVLGGGARLRLLNVGVRGTLGSWRDLPGVAGPSSVDPGATVQEIASVSGGIVVLVSDDAQTGYLAIGDTFFIPITSRGAGAPRLIARADYVAVALDHRDIWVEQAGAPPGRNPGRAWLVDESGRRLSAVLQLHSQVLLADTVRGLLTQSPSAEGASLISPATGVIRPAGIPADALVVAVGSDDVAWQAANCGSACSLNITNLRDGGDTVIQLPLRTFPDTSYPPTAAFDLAGQRLALAMDTTNREDRVTGTSVYVADISQRRLIRLPGGPIPLSTIPSRLGAVLAGSPDIVSMQWAASGLWIVATNGEDSQVAYWPGSGPLRVIPPLPGAAYTFNVADDATETASR